MLTVGKIHCKPYSMQKNHSSERQFDHDDNQTEITSLKRIKHSQVYFYLPHSDGLEGI